MPLSKAFFAVAAMGFGLSVAAGPAVAANSQPHKAGKADTSWAKGAPSKHKKNATEPS